jgi:hypothetical protein
MRRANVGDWTQRLLLGQEKIVLAALAQKDDALIVRDAF